MFGYGGYGGYGYGGGGYAAQQQQHGPPPAKKARSDAKPRVFQDTTFDEVPEVEGPLKKPAPIINTGAPGDRPMPDRLDFQPLQSHHMQRDLQSQWPM